jgi:hypothetical protein
MKRLVMLSAATMLLFALTPAKASQFDYSSFNVFQGQNITISSPTSVTADTGMIVLTGAGLQSGDTLDAWCVDLFHDLAGSAIFNIVPLTTAGSGSPNPSLTPMQINEMGTLMLRGAADTPGDAFGANTSTAFQLAIWGVEFGGTLLDNANGPLVTLVEQLIINAALGGVWYNPNSAVDLLDAPNGNQVLAFGVETPLPAALWMFAGGLGLLGMVGVGRKRYTAPSAFAA